MPPKKDAKKPEKKEGGDKAAADKPKAPEAGEAKGKKPAAKGKKDKK